jgi:predicted MFS family arabinose efflux permease
MSDAVAVLRKPLMSRTMLMLVMSATIVSLSMGLRQSLGIFQTPMHDELGISATEFGFVLAVQSLVWGLAQPFVGVLADRFGTRIVLIGSALVYALGLAIMAPARSGAPLDLGGGVLAGIGVAGTGLGVVMGAVSRAVPIERRSQAVGAVAAAGSLGTFLLAPIGQMLVGGFGWRGALVAFAAIAAAMAALGIWVGRDASDAKTAAEMSADERGVGEVLLLALRHPGYMAMTAAFFACGFQLVFITTHLPAYLAFCGLPPAIGSTALALIGLFNTAGTYVVGLLGARYSQKRLLALVYLLRTAAIVVYVLTPVSAQSTLLFAVAMGLLWLSVAPLVSGIIGRMFGLKHFGTLYGVVFFSHQLGSAAGAMLGGTIFDLTGQYSMAWVALIVIGLLAFVLQWPMDDRPPEARRRIAAAAPAAA